MTLLLSVVVALVVATLALSVVFVTGMRRKSPAVQTLVRKASRSMKGIVLRTAGKAGAHTSIVRHQGRRSGSEYATPVVAARTETGFVVALPYGPTTDWARNVLHAGHATVVYDGQEYEVDEPQVIEIASVTRFFAPKERRAHRRFDVRQAVQLRRAT